MFLQIYLPWFLLSSKQFYTGKLKGNKGMTGSKEGWMLVVSQGKDGQLVGGPPLLMRRDHKQEMMAEDFVDM